METCVDNMVAKKNVFDNYIHLDVTPLVEIFAVTVHGDKNDDFLKHNCEVYGKISISDKLGNKFFDMYDRGQNNPQSISLGQTLLLTGPLDACNAFIIPSEYVAVKVQLYDRARGGMVIADGSVTLDRTTSEEWSEDYQERRVLGSENNLFAKVHYAIFPYAVSATISVLFFHINDTFDSFKEDVADCEDEMPDTFDDTCYEEHNCPVFTDLFGTVSASSVYHSSLLFDKPVEESVHVKSGGFIELSKSVVAVPGYSSLKVKFDFFDGNTESLVATGVLEFTPQDNGIYKKDIVGLNGRIRVRVVWSVADEQLFYSESSLKRVIPLTPNISECSNEDALKRKKLLTEHHSPAALIDGIIFRPHITSEALSTNSILHDLRCLRCPVFEVFSVVVCGKDRKPFRFYGSVYVVDPTEYCLFSRDKSCPHDCPKSGTRVIIEGAFRRSFTATNDFVVLVDIKDVNGSIISRGFLSRRSMDIYVDTDTRMCTVIRGESGFVAIHYSYFPFGVSAVVTVKLHGKNLPAIVKGEISARYSNCESSSRYYQEKLFQSVLFYVPEGVLLDASESTLPLARPLFTLPLESYLVIETSLSVSPVGLSQGTESLMGKVGFTSNDDSPMRIVGQGDFYIEIFVKFSDASSRCQ